MSAVSERAENHCAMIGKPLKRTDEETTDVILDVPIYLTTWHSFHLQVCQIVLDGGDIQFKLGDLSKDVFIRQVVTLRSFCEKLSLLGLQNVRKSFETLHKRLIV
ncbi:MULTISPECIES: hypothetical protein [Ochrobactrum]|uniref:Uncharacterized protein n=1 Tax=Ochrobactrum chromiisoli TaxID=2993941 RepID=A0ABT3QPR4_9HYPH|nr:hypothetical protein [Ochrobactrum chromiisoli]MCX2697604.1 hypothetical protein [Ochrobactrum chromiisoli]